MYALFRKELALFFSTLMGYISILMFLLITGLFLWIFPGEYNILDFGYAQLSGLFLIAPFVFLFLIPALTMRSFSDENRSGTIEFIMTKPISDFSIIMAKFGASFILLIISILPTLTYYLSIYFLGFPKGNIDSAAVFGSYFGLLMIGSAFISIGLFSSSITSNQVISFIIAVVVSGTFYFGFDFINNMEMFGSSNQLIKSMGIIEHYSSISRGVIDSRDLIYFVSLTTLFLMLTRFSLQSKKW
jgi:ABC-2 type transport system permease protein